MIDRRKRNIEVFEDTVVFVENNRDLCKAVEHSQTNQKLYLEGETIEIPENIKAYDTICKTVISPKRSFEAAAEYARAGKKVCVLNFASATNPGGGVVNGSSAQEESLCRCSTLYWCLNTIPLANDFYMPHRQARDPLYNDDCIYTPDVVVCKTDTLFPARMKQDEWYKVDVITCAAPNLRRIPSNIMNPYSGDEPAIISDKELMKLHLKRIDRIFNIAVANGVQVLILGAFGCGAFVNPPEVVSKAFREVQLRYQKYFDTIEYAIYCSGSETENYKVFVKSFGKYDLERFIKAHSRDYEQALKEVKAGYKENHWMWYIFPQIKGLGYSSTSKLYEIEDIGEAKAYMDDKILGAHMIEMCESLLELDMDDPVDIFGSTDAKKLRSSMTLFEKAKPEIDLFGKVLDKYYGGVRDYKTLYFLDKYKNQ